MKKHLLSMALGLMVSAGAFAQVEFVDAKGEVIPDGSTVVRNEIEDALTIPGLGTKYEISGGFGLKNTSASSVTYKMQVSITDVPFGSFGLCHPNACWLTVGDYTGTYPTHKAKEFATDCPWTSPFSNTLAAGGAVDVKTVKSEWQLNNLGQTTFDKDKDKGSFTATYSLLVNNSVVSTINVLFTTDPKASTGIAGVKVDDANKTVVATYNAAGQQVAAGTKGLNIVKYSDGSTKKVVIK